MGGLCPRGAFVHGDCVSGIVSRGDNLSYIPLDQSQGMGRLVLLGIWF